MTEWVRSVKVGEVEVSVVRSGDEYALSISEPNVAADQVRLTRDEYTWLFGGGA